VILNRSLLDVHTPEEHVNLIYADQRQTKRLDSV